MQVEVASRDLRKVRPGAPSCIQDSVLAAAYSKTMLHAVISERKMSPVNADCS